MYGNDDILTTKIEKEVEKVKNVLKILDFSEEEINEHLGKISNLLLLNIAADILISKGYRSKDGKLDISEIENFVKENYSADEIKKVVEKSAVEVIRDYFEQILDGVDKEKIAQIEEVINS